MLTECPHCFTRVLPRPDGQCPACQQSTVDVRDADREFMMVTVHRDIAKLFGEVNGELTGSSDDTKS